MPCSDALAYAFLVCCLICLFVALYSRSGLRVSAKCLNCKLYLPGEDVVIPDFTLGCMQKIQAHNSQHDTLWVCRSAIFRPVQHQWSDRSLMKAVIFTPASCNDPWSFATASWIFSALCRDAAVLHRKLMVKCGVTSVRVNGALAYAFLLCCLYAYCKSLWIKSVC